MPNVIPIAASQRSATEVAERDCAAFQNFDKPKKRPIAFYGFIGI